MTQQAEGFIDKIVTRDGVGSRGPWALDNLVIRSADGTDLGMYGLGFRDDAQVPPRVVVGDYVRFSWEQDGKYRNVIKGTAKKVKDAPDRAAPAASTAPASAGNTQQNIHYQNSRTAAIQLVGVLLENKALPHSATSSKAGQAKAYEEILESVNKLTVQFHNDLETFRLFDVVADAGEVDTSPDGELPDAEPAEEGEDEPIA